MSRSIRQHLADLSGSSVRGLDYSKLASRFGKAAKLRDRQDLRNEVERERVVAIDEPHLDMMRRAIEEAIEHESADMNGSLPVISVFEASQVAKEASKGSARDVGLLNLVTHLERRWKANKEAHLTASDVLTLKDHYHRNFPKSAASSVVEGFTKSGWLDLEVGHLMEVASQIRTQDDFDYYIKEAGLHTNNPYNKKARNFILAMLNGRVAQEDKPFQVGITYNVVTPESAEVGDFEETGYEVEPEPADLLDIADYVHKYGPFDEASSYPSQPGDWWINTSSDQDFQTGAETQYEIHVDYNDGSDLDQRDFEMISKIVSGELSWSEVDDMMDPDSDVEPYVPSDPRQMKLPGIKSKRARRVARSISKAVRG